MRKPSMPGRGIDVLRRPELLQAPQALKLRSIDDGDATRVQFHMAQDRVVEDLGLVYCRWRRFRAGALAGRRGHAAWNCGQGALPRPSGGERRGALGKMIRWTAAYSRTVAECSHAALRTTTPDRQLAACKTLAIWKQGRLSTRPAAKDPGWAPSTCRSSCCRGSLARVISRVGVRQSEPE